jgi:hypothetical protein
MQSIVSFRDRFNPTKFHTFAVCASGRIRYRQVNGATRKSRSVSRVEKGTVVGYTDEYLRPWLRGSAHHLTPCSLRAFGRMEVRVSVD